MSSMRLLLVSTMALSVAACATQYHPLSTTAVATLQGRRLVMTARPPTPLFAADPGKKPSATGAAVVGGVAGGAVGAQSARPGTRVVGGAAAGAAAGALVGLLVAAAMSDAGALIVPENGVADPAPYIVRTLSEYLQRRYGLDFTQQALYITEDDPKQITASNPSTDLIIDVWIDNWSLEPFPKNSLKYRIGYTAHLRLIDAKYVHLIDGKKGIVIGHGACRYLPEDASNALAYDELLANSAQRLKEELVVASRFCVDEFQSKVLTSGHTR